MDPFLGEIKMFGGDFAPRGWALCNGQLLPINQNSALFAILGTIYGGDGRTTFALPELRGRVAMHPGNGPGLSSRRLGAREGVEGVILNTAEIPSHTHQPIGLKGTLSVNEEDGEFEDPTGSTFGLAQNGALPFNKIAGDKAMAADIVNITGGTISPTGGNLSHTNMQPYGCVNYIIALQGTFPSRS